MSATHNTLGAAGLNCRSTRSSATRTPGTRIVVFSRLTSTKLRSQRLSSAVAPACARCPGPSAEAKLHRHASGPVDASGAFVDLLGPRRQPRIAESAVRRCSSLPAVKPRAADAEHFAHHRDWEAGPLRRDDPVDAHLVWVSAAKKTAARLRISRSCFKRVFSRRSRRSSSRSALVSPSSRSWRSSCSCLTQLCTDRRSRGPSATSFTEWPERTICTASRQNSGIRRSRLRHSGQPFPSKPPQPSRIRQTGSTPGCGQAASLLELDPAWRDAQVLGEALLGDPRLGGRFAIVCSAGVIGPVLHRRQQAHDVDRDARLARDQRLARRSLGP